MAQRSAKTLLLLLPLLVQLCLLSTCHGASVGVVRVPRVYNILIRSDGALAPSEAVSADSIKPSQTEDKGKEGEEVEGEGEGEGPKVENVPPELPVLDPKEGGVQQGVNYTEVPLSRAYPLTRYTAPLLAPLSYLAPLHGGLILGPLPRLPDAEQHYAQPQQAAPQYARQQDQQYAQQSVQDQQYAQQSVQDQMYAQQLAQQYGAPQEAPRQFQLASPAVAPQQLTSGRQDQLRSFQLPRGAFEDTEREAVGVEAEEDEEEEEEP